MSEIQNRRIFRVNRFAVPVEGREEFMALVHRTHEVIRAQPGFIEDLILEQASIAGLFNVITILQFEGEHVLQPVIAAVAKSDEEAGIDRQALSRRLGVETNIGFYHRAVLQELLPA
ncbi:antibiotic biosynthesis monooxygenase [Neorhizobium galegae]|uniref:antibiotic biosynthesis monooxygenase n=1 Tax=Neorhizobium galegae TaxID=399 RepID=UPI002101DCAF|nr:antibiotic biosynthesis monooxygenase [Neorhizobium galegae]MCQ1836202.1 antibiotic biosynthesis monooxygenase [Neorhizobium galegae]